MSVTMTVPGLGDTVGWDLHVKVRRQLYAPADIIMLQRLRPPLIFLNFFRCMRGLNSVVTNRSSFHVGGRASRYSTRGNVRTVTKRWCRKCLNNWTLELWFVCLGMLLTWQISGPNVNCCYIQAIDDRLLTRYTCIMKAGLSLQLFERIQQVYRDS
jgi:hypothetical protein